MSVAILVVMKWNFFVVLISMSLMINDVEQLFHVPVSHLYLCSAFFPLLIT